MFGNGLARFGMINLLTLIELTMEEKHCSMILPMFFAEVLTIIQHHELVVLLDIGIMRTNLTLSMVFVW